MTDKVAIFIDGGYFGKVLKKFDEKRVDYLKLSEILAQQTNSERFRTYYYDCMPYQSSQPTAEEKARYSAKNRFIYQLKMLPRFEVRLGRLTRQEQEFIQKGVDNLITIDMISLSATKQIQKAILICGDSDLVPAIRETKDFGVIAQIYYYPGTINDELYIICDDRFEITKELIESCILESEKTKID